MAYSFGAAARRGTSCVKWDLQKGIFGREDLLPFWVADSDYATAPEILEEIAAFVLKGAFGYGSPDDAYLRAVQGWFSRRHGWEIETDWVIPSSGIVTALASLIRTFSEPGDTVVAQPPVYDPFYAVISRSGRKLVHNPLLWTPEGYRMDFSGLEKIFRAGAKLLILCSPHNPVGRVWTREELARLAGLCREYDVMLLSDEIHWDLLLDGHEHVSMGVFAGELPKLAVCTSASKTFNLAGLQTSNIVIPEPALRQRFREWREDYFQEAPNILGLLATKTAYLHGDAWVDAQNRHLSENAARVLETLGKELPEIRIQKPEGTYLLWLDMRAYGKTSGELGKILVAHGLSLNDGLRYGESSDGFMRFNVACSAEQLAEGLELFCAAAEDLRR